MSGAETHDKFESAGILQPIHNKGARHSLFEWPLSRPEKFDMCKEHRTTRRIEDELRLGILKVLCTARNEKRDFSAGAPGRVLMKSLNAEILQLEQALPWLRQQSYITTGERVFLITDEGVDYLIERLGPLGPGGTPPTDPSRVPRRPLPTSGDSSIALPLPETESTHEP